MLLPLQLSLFHSSGQSSTLLHSCILLFCSLLYSPALLFSFKTTSKAFHCGLEVAVYAPQQPA